MGQMQLYWGHWEIFPLLLQLLVEIALFRVLIMKEMISSGRYGEENVLFGILKHLCFVLFLRIAFFIL